MKNLFIIAAILVFSLELVCTPVKAENRGNMEWLGDSSLSIRTNPFETKLSNGVLQIKFIAGNGSGVVGMHDILGNKVFEATADDVVEFSTRSLKSGVYFIVWRENKNSFTRRIVIRHEN